jgi:hypothetical protein
LLLTLGVGCKKRGSESVAAADASDDGGRTAFQPDSAEDVACVSICAKRAEELKCAHGDQCRDACAKLGAAKFCVKQVHAFVACFTKQPLPEWQCSGDGVPVIGGQVCEGEQGSMSDCLMQTQGKL